MSRVTRRRFIQSTLAAAGTVAISHTKSSGKVMGANEAVRVAVAGLNGRGGSHVGAYTGMKDVQIAYLVDPDKRTYKRHLDTIDKKGGPEPTCVADVRKALEDKTVDAVSIATPNHWHALMTIWACQAGKDVYVEKPASHNVMEGRAAVDACRKYDRIVQHGTQSRASKDWAKLAEVAKSGKLGKLLVSYGLCYKDGGTGRSTRGNIGTAPVKAPPAEVDFNLWLGPAQDQPYHENLVHYRWHWFWDFGNGDIGNQGVHQMDIARWMIPGATLPSSVFSFGGRFGPKDQGETPNTQVGVFTFPGTETLLVFEVRGLKSEKFHGQDVGNILVFEAGTVSGANKFVPKGKTEAEPLPEVSATRGPGDNFANFVHAVRTRRRGDQHADILEGHYSAALCHLPNISYRMGENVPYQSGIKQANGAGATADAAERMTDHLKKVGVDLGTAELRLGRKLTFDPKAERFVGSAPADKLLTRDYRKPFSYEEKA